MGILADENFPKASLAKVGIVWIRIHPATSEKLSRQSELIRNDTIEPGGILL